MRLCILLVIITCVVCSVSTEYQKKVCNEDGSECDCTRGWVGADCTEPDRRRPTPCAWIPQKRYFKYQGYTGSALYLKQLKCRAKRMRSFSHIVLRGDTQWVDFGFNQIGDGAASIRDNVIAYMPDIQVITMDRSGVTSLPEDFLAQNSRLEFVDFKWNAIAELPENLFANNSKLIKVTLSGNPFTVIPVNLFQNNPALREVRIDFSRVTSLPGNLFQLNPNLRYLEASYSLDLQYLSARMFDTTPALEFVGLRNTWFLHPEMRKHFCEQDWCIRNNYPPISDLLTLLRQYFD